MLARGGLASLAAVACALCACAKGHSPADAGSDGGPLETCSQRSVPVSSNGAPHRFFTPALVPLVAGRGFSSSPVSVRADNTTVALFPVEGGIGAATSSGGGFSGSFLLADQADSPALAALGGRFFVGFRQGGVLLVGVSDGAQGLVQLGSGHGRMLQIPLPQGATAPGELSLAASSGGEVVAAFSATVIGGRTAVFVSRLQNAGCQACTLSFAQPVAAGPGNASETQPRVATGPHGSVAIAFVREKPQGPPAEAWISQGTLGATLSLRAALVDDEAAETAATAAYFSDGSLAFVYARLQQASAVDGGVSPAPELADVVARRLDQSHTGAAIRVHDDDGAVAGTHWLPGAAVDVYDRLWVSFYDTRFAAPGSNAWGPGPAEAARDGACTAVVMLARSDDKGATFRPNSLVTADGTTVPFDAVPGSQRRARAPLGPVYVTATDTELLVGYSDDLGVGRTQLAEAGLP